MVLGFFPRIAPPLLPSLITQLRICTVFGFLLPSLAADVFFKFEPLVKLSLNLQLLLYSAPFRSLSLTPMFFLRFQSRFQLILHAQLLSLHSSHGSALGPM